LENIPTQSKGKEDEKAEKRPISGRLVLTPTHISNRIELKKLEIFFSKIISVRWISKRTPSFEAQPFIHKKNLQSPKDPKGFLFQLSFFEFLPYFKFL
jgi:hypothetical protein